MNEARGNNRAVEQYSAWNHWLSGDLSLNDTKSAKKRPDKTKDVIEAGSIVEVSYRLYFPNRRKTRTRVMRQLRE